MPFNKSHEKENVFKMYYLDLDKILNTWKICPSFCVRIILKIKMLNYSLNFSVTSTMTLLPSPF